MSKIHIVFGPQGAGKTTYSKELATEVKGVHLSIDAWMWSLYGEDLPEPLNFNWIMKRVDRCEKLIWSTAKKISASGSDVILDLAFPKVAKRDLFKSLAEEANMESQLHYITAAHSIRRKRVLDRNLEKGESFSFEVTPGMFDFMEGEFQKPLERELVGARVIDTD